MCTKTRKTRKLLLKSGVLLLLRQEGGAVGTPPALGALQGEQEGWRAVARSGAESSAFLVMGGAEWRGVARSGAESSCSPSAPRSGLCCYVTVAKHWSRCLTGAEATRVLESRWI